MMTTCAIFASTLHAVLEASVGDAGAHCRLAGGGMGVEEAIVTWRAIGEGGVVAPAIASGGATQRPSFVTWKAGAHRLTGIRAGAGDTLALGL